MNKTSAASGRGEVRGVGGGASLRKEGGRIGAEGRAFDWAGEIWPNCLGDDWRIQEMIL